MGVKSSTESYDSSVYLVSIYILYISYVLKACNIVGFF